MREEKRRKEEEEKEAQKRAEEEERRRREEEEEARRIAEEKEERKRREEEARRKAEEEEEEAARIAQEAEKRLVNEPQTREDPDIELVTEEMLDDNLPVQETEEERGEEVNTSSHAEEEQARDEELQDGELDLEINGTTAEAGLQLDEKEDDEDLENQTLEKSDSESVLPSYGVPTSPGEGLDKNIYKPSSVEQKRVRTPAINKGPLSRSQEKREQRRRRGLEHNQRETERASSSAISKDEMPPPQNKSQETSRLKERVDSKELGYTFVAWKMKEDKRMKKEPKTSPPSAGPVRPSTLPLLPAEPVHERNGIGEGAGAVNLHRRPGAIKEKPEKWRGRRSDGEFPEGTSPPQPQNREERRKKQPLYVFCSGYSQISPHVLSLKNEQLFFNLL